MYPNSYHFTAAAIRISLTNSSGSLRRAENTVSGNCMVTVVIGNLTHPLASYTAEFDVKPFVLGHYSSSWPHGSAGRAPFRAQHCYAATDRGRERAGPRLRRLRTASPAARRPGAGSYLSDACPDDLRASGDAARTGSDTPAVGALGRRVLAVQAWNTHVMDM